MGCTVKNKCINYLPSSIDVHPQLKGLQEKGRIKFFFHSPNNRLPVRNVLIGKTEPHIEKNAENYCARCYQNETIIPFLTSNEKYLFLFTTNKNEHSPYCNYRYIVGYLEKQNHKKIGYAHYAVIGKIKLFSFKDSFPLIDIVPKKNKVMNYRVLKIDLEKTKILLNHFKNKTNIYDECVEEVKKLKKLMRV